MSDKNKIKRVSEILKRKFNNLTVNETIDLALDIVDSLRDEASYAFSTKEFGSFKVSGGKVDIDNLQSFIMSLERKIKDV